MKEITFSSTLSWIKARSEFASFRCHLDPAMGPDRLLTDHLPIRFVPGWRTQDIAGGFARMQQICQEGRQVFYPLHSEEECSGDPSLRQNVMFHFSLPEKAPFVVVVPGGGYGIVCSVFEGYPVAARLNNMGYHAFVVRYRVGQDAQRPNPQDDLAAAVRYIFNHADELNVDTNGYCLAGFSAGGHLAGSFATKSVGYAHYGLSRPGMLFLSYPVVTMGEYTHPGSRDNLLGSDVGNGDIRRLYSLEEQFDADSPPVYLWQCERDKLVPCRNSQLLEARLRECNVPYRYEVFPGNAHGWGLGIRTAADGWLERAVAFWRQQNHG